MMISAQEINMAPPGIAFALGKSWAENSIADHGVGSTARWAVDANVDIDSKAFFLGVLSAIGEEVP